MWGATGTCSSCADGPRTSKISRSSSRRSSTSTTTASLQSHPGMELAKGAMPPSRCTPAWSARAKHVASCVRSSSLTRTMHFEPADLGGPSTRNSRCGRGALRRPRVRVSPFHRARRQRDLTTARAGRWDSFQTNCSKKAGSVALRREWRGVGDFVPAVLGPQRPDRVSTALELLPGLIPAVALELAPVPRPVTDRGADREELAVLLALHDQGAHRRVGVGLLPLGVPLLRGGEQGEADLGEVHGRRLAARAEGSARWPARWPIGGPRTAEPAC